ncbi:MAG: hypothetical protein LBS94_03100 [Prevotellaceae bacterium]|jgi:hypothetical protein|nr:hypothetical protein [Prevotellaceae bacterium]
MNTYQQNLYFYYSELLKAMLNKVRPCNIVMEDDGKGGEVASCYATQLGASRGDVDEDLERDKFLAKDYLCCARWSTPDEPCQHWSPKGCRTMCLGCRTWLCKPALRMMLESYHDSSEERRRDILTLLATIQEANGAIRNYDIVAKPHNSFEFCDSWRENMPWED